MATSTPNCITDKGKALAHILSAGCVDEEGYYEAIDADGKVESFSNETLSLDTLINGILFGGEELERRQLVTINGNYLNKSILLEIFALNFTPDMVMRALRTGNKVWIMDGKSETSGQVTYAGIRNWRIRLNNDSTHSFSQCDRHTIVISDDRCYQTWEMDFARRAERSNAFFI